LSFLGVVFNAGERVARVRITSGNAALGPADSPPGTDVAVMDDFIYAEPQGAVTPTPTATLTSTPSASASPTLTATFPPPPGPPTSTAGGGPPLGTIPTLSFGMLMLLALGLATVAVLLIRRL
ncbi:MAG TPA: hypothetical protein VFW15_08430, partial [Thermoanaerobaculia bacterium]|nr:hypothetical protein [Thermoanaerobaculia bacterium]